MMRISEWLPLDAATNPRVRDALEGVVDEWASKWFAGARVSASFETRAARAPQLGGGWLLYGNTLALPTEGPERIRLAGLALGADPEGLILSEPDRDIIARLAANILSDLAAMLADAIGQPLARDVEHEQKAEPFDGEAGLALRITDARERVVAEALIPLSTLVHFLRGAIPRGPAPDFARIGGAIRRSAARLEFRLGETRLSLGDLTQLAPGDVLTLDRTIAAGASVALAAGSRTPLARATVEANGVGTRLTLAHEIGYP